jgi:hypothetical protein
MIESGNLQPHLTHTSANFVLRCEDVSWFLPTYHCYTAGMIVFNLLLCYLYVRCNDVVLLAYIIDSKQHSRLLHYSGISLHLLR